VRGNNEGTLIARLIRQLVGIPLFAAEPIPTIVVRSAQNGVYSRGPWSWLCASKWRHFADKLVLVYPFRTPPSGHRVNVRSCYGFLGKVVIWYAKDPQV
jgi:hypothetical protein